MKTGNITLDSVVFAQTKSMRDKKGTDKRETNKAVEEKVDLSMSMSSTASIPVPSYEEAIGLLRGIDFRQVRETGWMSKNGTAKLTELLQA